MIYRTLISLTLLAGASAASMKLFATDSAQLKTMWESYKVKYHKNYQTMEEENHRFNNFLESLRLADLRNEFESKNGGTAIHGVTFFSDMSQSEFESRYLTASPSSSKTKHTKVSDFNGEVNAAIGLVDWTGKLTTPVKDQVSFKFFSFDCC
jgi:hypothetical protein